MTISVAATCCNGVRITRVTPRPRGGSSLRRLPAGDSGRAGKQGSVGGRPAPGHGGEGGRVGSRAARHNGPMPPPAGLNRSLAAASAQRTAAIVDALHVQSSQELLAPSELPGWTRLTIACHLRYGAEALLRMTLAGVSGGGTAYYPDGRASQRPGTLEPGPGEDPREVVESLRTLSVELDHLWGNLLDSAWEREVVEPPDNPDLGPLLVSGLPLLRLTEVEVHGTDLGLGLDDWSELFVKAALSARLSRLGVRRTNHSDFDHSLKGSWLLIATDGPTFSVSVSGDDVESRPADPTSPATSVIEATSRDLLALLLGRPFNERPQIRGDVEFGEAFPAAFPAP